MDRSTSTYVPLTSRFNSLSLQARVLPKLEKEETNILTKTARSHTFAKAIEEISLASLQSRSIDELCASAPKVLATSLGAAFATIGELTPSGEVVFRASYGIPAELRVDGVTATPSGLTHLVAHHEGPLTSRDATSDERFLLSPVLRQAQARAVIAAPLRTEDGEPWGTIGAFFLEPRDFSAEEKRLMSSFANILGASIQRLLAYARAETERKQHETDLLIVETILETSPAMVVLSDKEGRIIRVNRATQELVGIPLEEILGNPFWDLGVNLVETDEAFRALEDAQQEDPPATSFTSTITRRDGSTRRVTWSIAPIQDIGQGEALFVSVGVDVSAQLRAEQEREGLREQLLHSQKMDAIGRVVGGVAHDFNNILMVLRTNARFLEETFGESDPRKQDIAEILSVSERAQRLVRQLLSFSRKDPVTERSVDISQTIAGMQGMLRQMIQEDITIRIDASEPGRTTIDPSHLEQVILNLVVNAREAMPGGGDLHLSSCQVVLRTRPKGLQGSDLPPGTYAVLEVSDTGTGIPADVLPNIFEPFFTTKPREKGTGLGLSTVYGIVERAGGSIAVSTAEGVGTTFTVYLPTGDAGPVTASPTVATRPEITHGDEDVLVVEDDEGVRDLVVRILSRAGYKATPAENGVEALRLLAEGHFDLMITDVIMPQLSGPELTDRARELHPGLNTLLMSGYIDDGSWWKGRSDPHPVLLKPFTPEALLRAVRTTLDQERSA